MRDALKRELTAIALLLLALFLAGALLVLGWAQIRTGVDVGANVGWVGAHLARPLVALLGWPGALLVPLVPAVHALRLFGRVASDADRSWMIFLAGLVLLVPVVVALASGLRLGDDATAMAGLWGAFVASYWRAWFGGIGSWILAALALSALTAATLAWNPIRALIGARAGGAAGEAGAPRGADLALSLEPPPEEMPSIDGEPEPADPESGAPPRKRPRKGSRAAAAAGHDERVAAEIAASAHGLDGAPDDELPSPELLTPAPERAGDGGKRELDEMGQKLIDALAHVPGGGPSGGAHDGPRGDAVRDRAGAGREGAAVREPGQRPGAGDAGAEHPHRGADSGAGARWGWRCRIRTRRWWRSAR